MHGFKNTTGCLKLVSKQKPVIKTGLKLENYYFFTFTFSRPEVRKLFRIYVFTFSRPEVRKLFRIYFFTFSRPEVGKLFLIHFFTFSRPEVGKLFRIYVFTFSTWSWKIIPYFDGLVQDCSNSSELAMELLQSCTKPSIYLFFYFFLTYFFSTWSWKIIPYLCFYLFSTWIWEIIPYFGGLVQDCSNLIANSLELLQSCRSRKSKSVNTE